jgi:hypothetical protein
MISPLNLGLLAEVAGELPPWVSFGDGGGCGLLGGLGLQFALEVQVFRGGVLSSGQGQLKEIPPALV